MSNSEQKYHGGLLAHANIEAYKRGLEEGKDNTSSDEDILNKVYWEIRGYFEVAFDLEVATVTNGNITEFSTKRNGKISFQNDQAFECKLMVDTMFDPDGEIKYNCQAGLFIRSGNMKAVLPNLKLDSNFDVVLMIMDGYLAKFASTNIGFEKLLAQRKADKAANDSGEFKDSKNLISNAFEIDLAKPLYFNLSSGGESVTKLINSANIPSNLIICRKLMEGAFKNVTDDLNKAGDQLYEKLQSVSKFPENLAQQVKEAWMKAGSNTTGEEIAMPPGYVSNKRLTKTFKSSK